MSTSQTIKIGGITLVGLLAVMIVASGGAAATHEQPTKSNVSVQGNSLYDNTGADYAGDILINSTVTSNLGWTQKTIILNVKFKRNSLSKTVPVLLRKEIDDATLDPQYRGTANLSKPYNYWDESPAPLNDDGKKWSLKPDCCQAKYDFEITSPSVNPPNDLIDKATTKAYEVDDAYSLDTQSRSFDLGTRSGDSDLVIQNVEGSPTVNDFNVSLITGSGSRLDDQLTAETLQAEENTTLFNGSQDLNNTQIWILFDKETSRSSTIGSYQTSELRFYGDPITHDTTDDGTTDDTTTTDDGSTDDSDDTLLGGGGGSSSNSLLIILLVSAGAVLLIGRS